MWCLYVFYLFIEFDASLHWFSRWILKQQIYNSEVNKSNNGEEFPGQHPSYRDPLKLALGCRHYKRNCKLFAACCNQLYPCIRCHDEVADHSLDRYLTHYIKKLLLLKSSRFSLFLITFLLLFPTNTQKI